MITKAYTAGYTGCDPKAHRCDNGCYEPAFAIITNQFHNSPSEETWLCLRCTERVYDQITRLLKHKEVHKRSVANA